MESRIRQLVMKLEYVDALTLAHPFVKGFDQTLFCLSDDEVRACASGEVSDTVLKRRTCSYTPVKKTTIKAP